MDTASSRSVEESFGKFLDADPENSSSLSTDRPTSLVNFLMKILSVVFM